MVVRRARDAITGTRSMLQTVAVQHLDAASGIANESALSQHLRRDGNRRAPRSEHESKKLMGQRNPRAGDAIMRHEQPSRTALLDGVNLVADHGLCDVVEKT